MGNGLWRRRLMVQATPETVFEALFQPLEVALWLESGGERGTGRSYLATGTPLPLVSGQEWDQIAAHWRTEDNDGSMPPQLTPPLGLVGWLAYDLARESLGVEVGGPEAGLPSRSVLVAVDRCLQVDGATGEVTAWALGAEDTPGKLQWVAGVEEALRVALPPRPVLVPEPDSTLAHTVWRDTPGDYAQKIAQARQFIQSGDAYQLCLTTEVVVSRFVRDAELYRLLRVVNPSPHQGLIRVGEVSLVVSSPETFLEVSAEGQVTTKPIKGTRPRDVDPVRDAAWAEELSRSEKEQAENLMIVDLMRNDLLRVCDSGSIQVPQLLQVESYPSVHQLVSTVTGTLRGDCSALDAIRACFPAGSMTGAPKHRAVSLLAGLESGPRGIYSGCFGVLRADGSASLAMTIRSAVVTANQVSLGVGGGITWSSEPEAEVAEVGHKARALLACLGVTSIQYS